MRQFTKNKTILLIISIIIIMGGIILISRIVSPEDSWRCRDGKWIKHGQPSEPQPTTGCGDNANSEESAIHDVNQTEKDKCENTGGIWTLIGNNVYRCNAATGDAGKTCTDGSDCEAGLCYTDLEGINLEEIQQPIQGTCPDHMFPTNGYTLRKDHIYELNTDE